MAARPRRVWIVLAAVAGLAAAVPLWCSQLLPFQDAPEHLAAVSLLSDAGIAAAYTRPWYEVDLATPQYTGIYVPLAWLARAIGPDAAIRVFLSLIALSLPLVSWMLLRAFDRDRRLAVFAPALFHTAPLYIGVYNFIAAVPVAVAGVALFERELRAPSRKRALLLSLLCAWLVYLHVSGLAIVFGAAFVLAVTAGVPLRRVLRAGVPLLPAIALLAFWTLHAPPSVPPAATATLVHQGPVFQSRIAQVRDLLAFANVLPGRVDEVFAAALVLLWFVLVFLPGVPAPLLRLLPSRRLRIWPGVPGETAAERRWWRLPLLGLGLLGAYLVAPNSLGYIAYIHLRAVPFLALFLLDSPLVAPTRRTAWALAAVVLLQLGYTGKLVAAYRAFDREAAPEQLRAVLQHAQPGQRLIALVLDRKSRAVHFEPYLHFGLYYQVQQGGRARFSFGELPWMPVRFRSDKPARPFPLHWEFQAGWFDWPAAAGDAEFVLVRTPDPEGDPADSPEPGPEFGAGFTLAAREGRWALFESCARAQGCEQPRRELPQASTPVKHRPLRARTQAHAPRSSLD